MSINLPQLKAFHFVAAEGSFTQASRRMNVTQPTVSAQVRLLEETYGVRLFERKGRSVHMTPLGEELHNITSRLFGLQDDAQELLEGARALENGHLVVGGDSPHAALPLIGLFRERYEKIALSLSTGNAEEALQDLYDFKTDVAILGNVSGDPRLIAQPLKQMSLVCFVHKNHPWAKRKNVSIYELESQPMVLRKKGSLTRRMFDEAAARMSIRPKVVMEISSREAAREAVANGIGVGVVLDNETGVDSRVRTIAFNNISVDMTEYVVCLKERSRLRVVKAFMDVAREFSASSMK